VNVLTTALNPFTKYLWVGAVGAVLAALAFSHVYVYRKGKHDEKLDHVAAVAAANEDSRRLERARQSRADQAASIAAGREARNRAAADLVGRERDRLQHALSVANERGAQSLNACRQHTATLEAVFGECRGQLQALGRDADSHSSDSLKLQQSWPTDSP
jgi:hypothetical protein